MQPTAVHTLAAAIAALVLVNPGAAQSTTPLTSVVVANPTPFARRDVASCNLAFAKGNYLGEPLFVDLGGGTTAPAQVAPFGARWSDGSWRYATVHVPVALGANETATLDLIPGPGQTPAFQWTALASRFWSSLDCRLRIDGRDVPFKSWQNIENGPVVQAWESYVRSGVMWGRLIVEARTGLDGFRFWLHYGDSLITDPAVTHYVGDVSLVVGGGIVPYVWHAASKVVDVDVDSSDAVVIQLTDDDVWGDGESQAVQGSFTVPGMHLASAFAEQSHPTVAVSSGWPGSGAFSPWGFVPPAAPGWNHKKSARRATKELAQTLAGTWGEAHHGCLRIPSSPGDQSDFSAIVLSEAANGFPLNLLAAGRSVYQEACRPTWIRNLDGSPYLFSSHLNRAEPPMAVWFNQVHHASGAGYEKLGKAAQPGTVRRWNGHDRQHYSINYIAYWTLLTGDRLGMSFCDHHAELWLMETQTATGNPTIDGLDVSRAEGRSLQVGCLLYLVTGRDEILDHARRRVAMIDRQWMGQTTSPTRPMWWSPPDPRRFAGTLDWWCPWFDLIGVRGLDAYLRLTGDTKARDLIYNVGKSAVEHGTWDDGTGKIVVGYTVWWKPGGAALTAAEIASGNYRETSTSDFNPWCIAGIRATRREAVLRGDAGLAALCDRIINQYEAEPFSWRHSEWDGAR